MGYSIPLILLTFCAWISAEPLGVGIERRRNTYPVYASEFMEEYEPYAIAAFPIHAPVPILQVISPTTYTGKLRKPVKRQPNRDLHTYASSTYDQVIDQDYDHIYTDSISQTHPKYKGNPYDDDASSFVVYARPNKNGGYSYRKPPAPTPKEPIIIRIHKYKVIH